MSIEEEWNWDNMMLEVGEISVEDELKGGNELSKPGKVIIVVKSKSKEHINCKDKRRN
jgi:hypothetical protein